MGPVRHLRRRAGEVDGDVAAPDRHRDLDRQIAAARIVAVEKTVEDGPGPIDTVRQGLDRHAHDPLGMIHQLVAGRLDRVQPITLDQLDEAVGADAGGGDLGLHVANHQVRGADIVAQHLPQRLVQAAAVVDLERLELQSLGVGIHGVDNAATARTQGADIQMMGGGHGKPDQAALTEHRNAEGDVGAVRGAVIG